MDTAQPIPAPHGLPAPSAGGLARATAEVLRAVGGFALLPPRTLAFLAGRRRRLAELEGLLGSSRAPDPVPALPQDAPFLERPLRLFLSSAEASGEGHTLRLLDALRRRIAEAGGPEPEVRGLGGAELAEAGVAVLADPVERATMGFGGIASSLPFYANLLARSADTFRTWRPDLCLPVDSPALHVPLARAARRFSVPVVHHVTPQLWAWAPWRLSAYRRTVDLALSILPFEPEWFSRRAVPVAHVGHPLADALVGIPRSDSENEAGPLVVLPGSRTSVIERNLPWMLETLAHVGGAREFPRVQVLSDDPARRPLLEELAAAHAPTGIDVRVVCGDLHAQLIHARAALSVSGTILLDLLHHRLPTVVLYRLTAAREEWMFRHMLTTPWFSSVNLLAGGEVLPEFCFCGEGPRGAVGAALGRALFDDAWRATCRSGLDEAAANLGGPGAADRAAGHALALAAARAAGGAHGTA